MNTAAGQRFPDALSVVPLSTGGRDPFARLRRACKGLEVFSLSGLSAGAHRCLTARERQRFENLGERRRRSYLAARVALKRLACHLDPDLAPVGSRLETVAREGVRPVCPVGQRLGMAFAAAAHDDEFVVAVADECPLGVDVERIDERILRLIERFPAGERSQLERPGVDRLRLATRLWTARESAAKVFDLGLGQAFSRVSILRVGSRTCQVRFADRSHPALFVEWRGHVFCLLRLVS